MRDNATSEPEKYVNDERYRKFMIVRKSDGTGYTVNVREEVVEAAYNHAGWLVIISNDVMDAREALRIYRAKDVVEKGFLRLKNSLDVGRLRVHGQNAMRNKVFIGFIALILLSQIHNVMLGKDMYKKWTLKEMLRVLSKQRVQDINDTRVFFPPTKEQKEIFDMFDVWK
jgi:transposase